MWGTKIQRIVFSGVEIFCENLLTHSLHRSHLPFTFLRQYGSISASLSQDSCIALGNDKKGIQVIDSFFTGAAIA